MRHLSIQFAPLERAQSVRDCRRSVQSRQVEARQDMSRNSFSAHARNVGITWKVILLLWLVFLAALCLRMGTR